MKTLIFIIAAVAFTACSSTKKTETAEAQPSAVEKKVMEATSTDVAPEKTAKAKKAVKEVTTSSSTEGGLPAITGTEKSAITCSSKGETRKITTLNVTEGGCGVVYNKAGEDKTVALAKVDMNYCESVSSKIKTNLEGAGFNCGGATAQEATSSSDAPASKQ